jgi:hypothetical protein
MSDNRNWGELVFFSGIAGAVAAPIKLLVHHVFVWAKLATPFYSDLNAFLIHGHHHVNGMIESFFGEMGDMAMGAIFGVVLGVWLARSHPRYH